MMGNWRGWLMLGSPERDPIHRGKMGPRCCSFGHLESMTFSLFSLNWKKTEHLKFHFVLQSSIFLMTCWWRKWKGAVLFIRKIHFRCNLGCSSLKLRIPENSGEIWRNKKCQLLFKKQKIGKRVKKEDE